MRIMVVDVAAESRGALSVLLDFANSVKNTVEANNVEWYFITSLVKIEETANVHNIQVPKVKKSWLSRIHWEYHDLKNLVGEIKPDLLLSLQNNAFPINQVKQIVFFHNILLIDDRLKFSPFKSEERTYWVYQKIVGPYIRFSWKRAAEIIVQSDIVKQQMLKWFRDERITVNPTHITIPDHYYLNSVGKIKGYIYPAGAMSYKNHAVIIRAVKELSAKGIVPEILFTIAGNENDYAKRLVEESKGISNIRFIGQRSREELFQLYKEYGLVFSSRLESLGIPIIEAMSLGTVVVAINEPYVRQIQLDSNYNRLYIANNSAIEFSEKLVDGLNDTKTGNYYYDRQQINSNGLVSHILALR